MKPAYITRIKNEEDLIYYNLLYHYNIGFRDFYVVFNDSNEATRELVHKFKAEKQVFLHVHENPGIAYQQPPMLNKMSQLAYENGCDWIIPVNADEIIHLTEHKTIQEFLEIYNDTDCGHVTCEWIDYHPYKSDNNDPNYFTSWKYRDSVRNGPVKLIIKWHPDMQWGDGHHLVFGVLKDLGLAGNMFYAHFPNRSKEQLRTKIINIGKSFIEQFGSKSGKPQVKMFKNYEKKGDIYFNEIWDRVSEKRKNIDYIYDPLSTELFL